MGDEIHLKDTNDNVIHTAQNDQSHTRRDTVGSNLNLVAHDEESGWVAYASWFNTGLPISSFTTTWSVPPVPATDHGQTGACSRPFSTIPEATGPAQSIRRSTASLTFNILLSIDSLPFQRHRTLHVNAPLLDDGKSRN